MEDECQENGRPESAGIIINGPENRLDNRARNKTADTSRETIPDNETSGATVTGGGINGSFHDHTR
jgi:hypothetical protein